MRIPLERAKRHEVFILVQTRAYRSARKFSESFTKPNLAVPRGSRLSPSLNTLAPSPRILAHLLRRGRIPASSMALTVSEPATEAAQVLQPPPAVVTTPCDPWPRPYYLEDGLRRVAPYHFTYNTNVKERWRGREILEIFKDEFRDRPEEYYVCRTRTRRCSRNLTDNFRKTP